MATVAKPAPERYSSAHVVLAKRLIRIAEGLYSTELDKRIFLDDLLDTAMARSQQAAFIRALTPWVHMTEHTKLSILIWAIDEKPTVRHFIQTLEGFVRYVSVALAVADLLHKAASALRKMGWVQGDDHRKGFDLIGVLNEVDPDPDPIFRVIVLDALRDQLRSQFDVDVARSLTEWNDEPGRTASQVVALLEGCATTLVTF